MSRQQPLIPHWEYLAVGMLLIIGGAFLSIVISSQISSAAIETGNYSLLETYLLVHFVGLSVISLGGAFNFYWFLLMIRRVSSPTRPEGFRICPRCRNSCNPAAPHCWSCGLRLVPTPSPWRRLTSPTQELPESRTATTEKGTATPTSSEPSLVHTCAVCGQPATRKLVDRWLCDEHLGAAW